MVSVAGLRVMVTAGGSGNGYAIAQMFVANGARVHVCDVMPERLAALEGMGATLCDVSSETQVDNWFTEAQAYLGGLDVLVNNAGISGPAAKIEDVATDAWEQTLAVNLTGQFFCCRRAVPLLKANGSGSIVNISSTAGLYGYPLRSPYAASKWAVIGLTKTLAMELGTFNIRVNAICPGSINNPRMDGVIERESVARGIPQATIRQNYLNQVSMQTFIDPEEIASMTLFICSDAGRHISGQALCVDGHTETMRS